MGLDPMMVGSHADTKALIVAKQLRHGFSRAHRAEKFSAALVCWRFDRLHGDKTAGLADDVTPQRGIQRGIVDLTDE